jgi:hypothetical protein
MHVSSYLPSNLFHSGFQTKMLFIFSPYLKGKGKAIPLQAWAGPEGFRKLRLPDFKKIST